MDQRQRALEARQEEVDLHNVEPARLLEVVLLQIKLQDLDQ